MPCSYCKGPCFLRRVIKKVVAFFLKKKLKNGRFYEPMNNM